MTNILDHDDHACAGMKGTPNKQHTLKHTTTEGGKAINGLFDLIGTCEDGKVVVFVSILAPSGIIEGLYKNAQKRFTPDNSTGSIQRLHSNMNKEQQEMALKFFRERDNQKLLIADPRLLQHGVRIDGVKHVIWYGEPTKDEIYTQANARVGFPNTGIKKGVPLNADAETNSPKENTND